MSRWPRARVLRGGDGGGGGLEGVLPHMPYAGICRWQGMVSDLSVLTEVCNFVRVSQQGIACTIGFICWINFIQYKGNDYNVNLL